MQELNAQLNDLDSQIRTATDKVVRGLDSDARMAQARVDNMTAAINSQKDLVGATGPDQVKLSELDLTARLLKDQLEFNTSKYQEALARENAGSNPADARVISRAAAPQLPTFPKKLPTIVIMTLAGAILSLGILIARELLSGRAFVQMEPVTSLPISLADDRMPRRARTSRSLDDTSFTLKPTLTPVPTHEAATVTPDPVRTTASDPLDVLIDDLVRLKQPDLALRILVLSTSLSAQSDPISVRLGRALSRTARTIAVDLALEMHPGTDGSAKTGLVELLDGEASFAEVIHRDPASRLHFIPSGGATAPTSDGKPDEDGVANVLDALAETYDFVLMSGLAATDAAAASIAGDHADALVVVADHGADTSGFDALRTTLHADAPDGLPFFVFGPVVADKSDDIVKGAAA